MRLASLKDDRGSFLGVRRALSGDSAGSPPSYLDVSSVDPSLGTDVGSLLASGVDWPTRVASAVERAQPRSETAFLPLVVRPPKLLCLGLNDREHAEEGNFEIPDYPAVFARVASSLIGHRQPMLRPPECEQLDYEVELAVVVGRGGRRIREADALSHVAGYTVFNDGTLRAYQRKTPQWTIGKNWHGTGALGPELVTSDELPPGAAGLELATFVGEERLQFGNTSSMIFSVARTIELMSEVMVLEPGDVIAMGTVRGVGHARCPPRWLKPGETVRASIEQIGEIQNLVVDEQVSEVS